MSEQAPEASVTSTTGVPKPDKIVTYSSSKSSLLLYGDVGSAKIALLCPGFPDDQTVFQPFAKALSEKGMLVGVMCLPGYEHSEEVPWTNHNKDGYTFDEMTQAVREASKALRAASTHKSPELTGMFHDWGCFPGAMWSSRLEEEAKDASGALKPHKMVYFDVVVGPSPKAKDVPTDVEKLSTKEAVSGILYWFLFALGFLVQRYISKPLAPLVALPPLIFLTILGLTPTYDFDNVASEPFYGDKKPGLDRLFYMTYPYLNHFKLAWSGKNLGGAKALVTLHEDWKSMPILYLYGEKKKTQFHNFATLEMLKREEREKLSLSKAVGVKEGGHYLFIQKQDECLKEVLDFVNAENTFVSS